MQNISDQGTTVMYQFTVIRQAFLLTTLRKNRDQTKVSHHRVMAQLQVPDRQHCYGGPINL